MNDLQEILSTLQQAYGTDKGGWIYGAYRLAETAVALDRERAALAEAAKPKTTHKRKSDPTPLHAPGNDQEAG